MSTSSAGSAFEVSPRAFDKRLVVPTSKSYANRLLVLAALSRSPFCIQGLPASSDVTTMLDCLKALGLKIRRTGDDVVVENSFPDCEGPLNAPPLTLKTGDGGTTNRFLLGLLARGERTNRLNAEGHMRERPMQEMLEALGAMGVRVRAGNTGDPFWLEIKGPLSPPAGELPVDCSRSTQFATGLALALADAHASFVRPVNMDASAAYWEMTEDLIERFQVGQTSFRVPVDFSSLSYPLAAGLTLGPVLVENCFERDLFQADSAFLEIIPEMGGKLEWTSQGLRLSPPSELRPFSRDCSGHPDLVPTLAYVCSYAQGESRLRNVEVLRHKESDRIEEILKLLRAFGIPYRMEMEGERETLVIEGQGLHASKSSRPELHPAPDHRMVMVSYLFARRNNGGRVHNAHHVAKSFPDFFDTLE